jgi:excisionase family DNA binding protein
MMTNSTGAGMVPPPANRLDMSEYALLTIAEVAAVMRVSKMTVYRLVHTSELPSKRIGRAFRVPAQAVRDYLDSSPATPE